MPKRLAHPSRDEVVLQASTTGVATVSLGNRQETKSSSQAQPVNAECTARAARKLATSWVRMKSAP